MAEHPDLPATIAEIWSSAERTARWHQLWIEHLKLRNQMQAPNEPLAGDIELYEHAAQADPGAIHKLTWRHMAASQHELVAALQAFNQLAGVDSAHRGLASSDIVDVTTQGQIADSLALIIEHAHGVADQIRRLMVEHAERKLVGRTHGQPAQLTTWGHRQATILSPLLDWLDRAGDALCDYPLRPPIGAVGTGADLLRVLGGGGVVTRVSRDGLEATTSVSDGAGGTEIAVDTSSPDGPRFVGGSGPLDRYADRLAAEQGFRAVMDTSRQTYHRSYDQHIASLLSELASIAQTWASDRRLEAMLGLGNESHLTAQSASSSMAQKLNPRFSERVTGLAIVTRGYANTCAELASVEWLEGDVSTSAARKLVLPAIFQTADDLLSNWHYVTQLWRVDEWAIKDEVWRHRYEWATAAIMQALVELGLSRADAHQHLRQAWDWARRQPSSGNGVLAGRFEVALGARMSELALSPVGGQTLTKEWLRTLVVRLMSEPVGNIADQIDQLDRRTQTAVSRAVWREWKPEVTP